MAATSTGGGGAAARVSAALGALEHSGSCGATHTFSHAFTTSALKSPDHEQRPALSCSAAVCRTRARLRVDRSRSGGWKDLRCDRTNDLRTQSDGDCGSRGDEVIVADGVSRGLPTEPTRSKSASGVATLSIPCLGVNASWTCTHVTGGRSSGGSPSLSFTTSAEKSARGASLAKATGTCNTRDK